MVVINVVIKIWGSEADAVARQVQVGVYAPGTL
jgi:hypothetical protein